MDQEKMGKFISELRKEKGLTQKDIGDRLNISDNSVSKWERGINAPDIYYLGPLSELFGVSIKELLNGERYISKNKKKMDNRKPTLEVTNLSKKLSNKTIISDINMTIYEGEVVGLIGPNGSGKSTLIKTILDLYHSNSGNVKICGFDLKKDFEKALSNIGCIVERPDLYLYLTGMQNLKMTMLINNIQDIDYVKKIIKLVGLEERINDKVKKYSLGMKQRLCVANALIRKPKLLILDEPTNGLDLLGIKELRDIIKNISQNMGVSVLISSHILMEVEAICDYIYIINEGKIIEEFSIDAIKRQNISLEEEFLRQISNVNNERGVEHENN